MTSPFVVQPDFDIWAPALPPLDLAGFGLSLQEWAAKDVPSSVQLDDDLRDKCVTRQGGGR